MTSLGQRHQKDYGNLCPGSGFLVSTTKANSSGACSLTVTHPEIGTQLFKPTDTVEVEKQHSLSSKRPTNTSCRQGYSAFDARFGECHINQGTRSQSHSSVMDSNNLDDSGHQCSRHRDYHTDRSCKDHGKSGQGSISRDSKEDKYRHSQCRFDKTDRYENQRCSRSVYKTNSARMKDSYRKNHVRCCRSSDKEHWRRNNCENSHRTPRHRHRSHSRHRSRSGYCRSGNGRCHSPKNTSPVHRGDRSRSRRRRSPSGSGRRRELKPVGRSPVVDRSREEDHPSLPSEPRVSHPHSHAAKIHSGPENQHFPQCSLALAVKNSASYPNSLKPSSRRCHHSVSKLLLNRHQRGEASSDTLLRQLVLSTASGLQKTDSCRVFSVPESHESLEHMMQMTVNENHDQLLCMWSVSGTALQQVQLLSVKNHGRTKCKELPLEFTLSDTVVQTWASISSLCWVDCPWLSNQKMILYTTNTRSSLSASIANIHCMDHAGFSGGIHHVDFLLGNRMVKTCAWNGSQRRFSAGMSRGCQVVNVATRQLWEFSTGRASVLSQAFSKIDGGNLLFSGVCNGFVLMHDTRRDTRRPIRLVTHGHRNMICDLKLSADERHIFTGDNMGQIKRWDLRMCRTLVTYDGLFNQQGLRLPFHIDDTQSVLYAAGTDCCTRMWCLESGQLLCSIPPPYRASPFTVPAVQFSSKWAGLPGNMGLVMGAHTDLYLYSAEL